MLRLKKSIFPHKTASLYHLLARRYELQALTCSVQARTQELTLLVFTRFCLESSSTWLWNLAPVMASPISFTGHLELGIYKWRELVVPGAVPASCLRASSKGCQIVSTIYWASAKNSWLLPNHFHDTGDSWTINYTFYILW